MTKEELWKEAVEYAEKINLQNVNISGVVRNHISQAYFAGAEPREKQIEIDAKQIRALQKQNGELTDKVNDLEEKLANADYQLEGRDLEIKELKAQIEKMKNWCNCKNYQQCLIELAEQGKGMKPSECCVNCKKWEIKEK